MSAPHQGKFHLLILFFLPTLLVSIFIVKSWALLLFLVMLLIGLIIVIFRKKENKY